MHRRRLLHLAAAGTLAPFVPRGVPAIAEAGPAAVRRVRIDAGPIELREAPSLRSAAVALAPSRASGVMDATPATVADGYRWVPFTLDETGATGWVPTWHLAAIDQ